MSDTRRIATAGKSQRRARSGGSGTVGAGASAEDPGWTWSSRPTSPRWPRVNGELPAVLADMTGPPERPGRAELHLVLVVVVVSCVVVLELAQAAKSL